jgi:hypothetical protein
MMHLIKLIELASFDIHEQLLVFFQQECVGHNHAI